MTSAEALRQGISGGVCLFARNLTKPDRWLSADHNNLWLTPRSIVTGPGWEPRGDLSLRHVPERPSTCQVAGAWLAFLRQAPLPANFHY